MSKGIYSKIKRIRVRKREKKPISKKVSYKTKQYSNIKIDNNRSTGDYISNPSNTIPNIIIDENEKKDKKEKSEKEEEILEESNKKLNVVNFDHRLTDFEYKLKYLNLKDLEGAEYGRYFPPIRNKLMIIDSENREYLVIRAGNNQITGDLLSFFKKNDLKPGVLVEIEYDPDIRSDNGLNIIKINIKN